MKISTDYPFNNRAAIYGDGCFTTAAIENGKVELLEHHLLRLQNACQRLKLDISVNSLHLLEQHIANLAAKKVSGVLKVLISAGNGGRGYRRDENSQPEAYLQLSDTVAHYAQWRNQGISLSVSKKKLALDEDLSQLKHLNRLEQVLLREQQLPGEDAIVCDYEGMVVESFAGNVFWYASGRWFTPELSKCGVSGIMRNYILECLTKNNRSVSIVRVNLEGLCLASEIFICNSLMKIVPVNQIVDANGDQLMICSENTNIKELVNLINSRVSYQV